MFLTRRHAPAGEELNRLLDGFFGPAVGLWPNATTRTATTWPRFDVSETDSAIHVSAELPGVNQNEVDVEVHADTLRISGEKKDERVVTDHSFHVVERRFGKFDRTVTLPAEVDGGQAEATFKDGVLTIHLPKVKPVSAQKITIKSAT
jgi:HSP20 family protein